MNRTRLALSALVLVMLAACGGSSGPPPNTWDDMTWGEGSWA